MAQTSLETAPAGAYAILIRFGWGNGNVRRYTRWTSDIAIGSAVWASEYVEGDVALSLAKSEIDFGNQHGGAEDVPVRLTLPAAIEPVKWLVAGYAFAPVSVTISECDPTDPEDTRRLLYGGFVATARRFPGGRGFLAELELEGVKARLALPILGVRATTTCPWRFGDQNCGIDLDTIRIQGEVITEVVSDGDPRQITVSVSGVPDLSNQRWAGGYIERDGLQILIRRSRGDGRFDLANAPPDDWFGQQVVLTPGCKDKTVGSCRYWNNEEFFGGYGHAMPNRNPILEDEP